MQPFWNSFLSPHDKSIPHLSSFLKQIQFKLLNSNNETKLVYHKQFFLMPSFFTASLSLIKSAGTGINLLTRNFSTSDFKLGKSILLLI